MRKQTHAPEQGMKSVKVRTADTDVVIILAGAFMIYVKLNLWQTSGLLLAGAKITGFTASMQSVTAFESKGHELCLFHTLTGYDTTSAFKGGKKSAWQAWQAYEEVTETLEYLASNPFEILDVHSDHFRKIERLIVILYDRTSPLNTVNEVREELFCRKNRSVDRIPPMQDALLQHVRRAVYQAGIWTMSTQAQQVVPSSSARLCLNEGVGPSMDTSRGV